MHSQNCVPHWVSTMTEQHDEIADARITARYREDGSEEPDAAIDARILSAAREAVSPTPGSLRFLRSGLAAAAVVVLSATLVLTLRPPREEPLPVTRAPAGAASVIADTDSAPQPAREAEPAAAERVSAAADELASVTVTAGRMRMTAEEDEVPTPAARKATAQLAESRAPRDAAGAASAQSAKKAETTRRLAEIGQLWESGDHAAALAELEAFAEDNPDYPEEALRDSLPDALIAAWEQAR